METPSSVSSKGRRVVSRREFLKLAGIGAGAVTLASCGAKATPTAPAGSPAAPESVELDLFVNEGGEGLEIFKNIVKAFNEKNPNIQINPTIPSSGDYYTVLMTQIGAGTPPPLMQIDGGELPPYADRGALIALDDYIEADPEGKLDDFFPEVLKVYQWEGKTYVLPKDMVTWGLFYNKTLFDEAGLPYPGDWTEEDYQEAAKALTITDSGGSITQYGNVIVTPWGNYFAMVWQHGGQYLNEEHTKCLLNEPAAYEGLQFWADLINVHKTSPPPSEYMGFETGKVAMMLEGSYMVPGFQAITEFEWDIAHKPKGPAGRSSSIYSAGFGISPTCKYPDQGWEFVKYMTYEGSETLAALGYSMPSRKSIAEKPGIYVGAEKTKGKNVAVFMEAREFARFFELTLTWPQQNAILSAELDKVWLGQTTAKEATATIAAQIDELLASEQT